ALPPRLRFHRPEEPTTTGPAGQEGRRATMKPIGLSLTVVLTLAVAAFSPATAATTAATKETKMNASTAVAADEPRRPFTCPFSDPDIAKMRKRNAATRWPERETVADASQGVPLATMRELAAYWATDYDWRKAEAQLNSYPQFITNIDGLDI